MAYRRTPAVQDRLDALRQRIVTSAIDMVARHGYGGCSIAAVASHAGIGTGTVYRHFANKGELFTEVFRLVSNQEVAALEAARDAAWARSHSGVDALAAAVQGFAERVLSAPTLAYALLAEPVDPQVDTERLFFRRTFRDALAVAIDDAVVCCEIPPQDTSLTAACAVGAIAEALVLPLTRGATDAAVVPAIVSVVIRSLGRCEPGDFSDAQNPSASL
ncbi:TetR/AcrR family transcriptional regulator [Mycobacterium hodleri]|uniref:TetR/AcrR family transcriptional regulator n=1 Tax=Mycolicibacterium hodleri TaxID=49897 RepID=A0A502E8K4_9MYCO|nr:TetR/AcrR family transcriptional regulator [Mycolicibacterium hodleri]